MYVSEHGEQAQHAHDLVLHFLRFVNDVIGKRVQSQVEDADREHESEQKDRRRDHEVVRATRRSTVRENEAPGLARATARAFDRDMLIKVVIVPAKTLSNTRSNDRGGSEDWPV